MTTCLQDFHAGIPGFEPLANIALESKILQITVKTKLSRQTRKLIERQRQVVDTI